MVILFIALIIIFIIITSLVFTRKINETKLESEEEEKGHINSDIVPVLYDTLEQSRYIPDRQFDTYKSLFNFDNL